MKTHVFSLYPRQSLKRLALIAIFAVALFLAILWGCQDNNPVNSSGVNPFDDETIPPPPYNSKSGQVIAGYWPTFVFPNSELVQLHDDMVDTMHAIWLAEGLKDPTMISQDLPRWIDVGNQLAFGGIWQVPENYANDFQEPLSEMTQISQNPNPEARLVELIKYSTKMADSLQARGLISTFYCKKLKMILGMMRSLPNSNPSQSSLNILMPHFTELERLAQTSSERVFVCVLYSSSLRHLTGQHTTYDDMWGPTIDLLGGLSSCLLTCCNPFASMFGSWYCSTLYAWC